VSCSWDRKEVWGRIQTYSQGIRRPHCNCGAVLVWSWKRIQEWLIGPRATLSPADHCSLTPEVWGPLVRVLQCRRSKAVSRELSLRCSMLLEFCEKGHEPLHLKLCMGTRETWPYSKLSVGEWGWDRGCTYSHCDPVYSSQTFSPSSYSPTNDMGWFRTCPHSTLHAA
jgi:hypothetical protein